MEFAHTHKGVYETARIASAAGGGEILGSVATLGDPGVRVTASVPRTLTLKGVSDPVEVAAISW
jgi:hypothetical protein